MDEGFVMKAEPISVAELAEQLAKLPPGTKVLRISRDNHESLMSMSFERDVYQGAPLVQIQLELPAYTRVVRKDRA